MSLSKQYQSVREEIQRATLRALRKEESVKLIAVSKTFPSEDIRTLYQLGQRDFGENYVQEWAQKTLDLADCQEIVWHIIGHVQSNKTRLVAEHAHWLHTLDRLKLARRLNEQRSHHLPPLNVLIEINIAQDSGKHGIHPDEMLPLAKEVLLLNHLKLRGLMCVAQQTKDTSLIREQFKQMQALLQELALLSPDIDTLSMGMSQDMLLAIESGSTMVRIGSAIFGQRTYSS